VIITKKEEPMSEGLQARHLTAAYWEGAEAPDPQLGAPVSPGEFLKVEFLVPLGISINRFASDLSITYRRAHEIVAGKRGVTAETALLLAKYLGTSPQFWLNLQANFELERLRGQVGEKLARVRPAPRHEAMKDTA
jgi:addiction module HigA family antidote